MRSFFSISTNSLLFTAKMITLTFLALLFLVGWLILLPFKLVGFAIRGIFRLESAIGWFAFIALLLFLIFIIH